jgi:short-subunit dehydrogenase
VTLLNFGQITLEEQIMRLPKKRTLLIGAAGTVAAGVAAGALASAGVVIAAGAFVRRLRMTDMAGKVVLITGGSRGLGFAIAREFVSLGSRVAICARDHAQLERAATELRVQGGTVLPVACDVSNTEQVAQMMQRIRNEFGPVDVLVNNAGITSVGPIETQTIEDFREAMDVMFWGQVNTILAVLPEMQQRRSGWIANISSIGGKVSVPHLAPYSCAKFASTGLSEGLTAELAKDGIHVTTVIPGLMRTGSHVNAFYKGDHKAEYASFSLAATNPLTSISARRAARSIVNAIRRGQTELIVGVPAKVAVAVHGLLPGTTARLMGITNRVLPGTGAEDKSRHRGHESESAISRSRLTELGKRASREYLQHTAV